MNVKWSSEEDERLIDFVRVHNILYNVKNKGYRQTQRKHKLWCEVGEILSKTDTDCYKRWCYVRDYYIRRKGKPGSSGEAAKKRSDLLSFLDSVPSSQRNNITNVIKGIPGDISQDNSRQTPFQNQETEDVTFNNEEAKHNKEKKKGESNEDINKHVKGDVIIKSNMKRKDNSNAKARFNLLEQIDHVDHRTPSPRNEVDETDLFFSSMAKIVKKLPRYEQAQLRMQIGSLVGNAELHYISINASPMSVSPRPSTSASNYSETETPSPEPTIVRIKK